jgi:hypothetical protein
MDDEPAKFAVRTLTNNTANSSFPLKRTSAKSCSDRRLGAQVRLPLYFEFAPAASFGDTGRAAAQRKNRTFMRSTARNAGTTTATRDGAAVRCGSKTFTINGSGRAR